MADLYPTKTRLKLLRAVAAAKVRHYPARGQFSEARSVDQTRDRRCTSEIAEMRRAGWVSLRALQPAEVSMRWQLTAEGRKVLEEADRGD